MKFFPKILALIASFYSRKKQRALKILLNSLPDLGDLVVKFEASIADQLLTDWVWLVGKNKTPLMIYAIGDLFLMDRNGIIYWLGVGGGELNLAAKNIQEFKDKLKDIDQVNEWFMIDLTTSLKTSGLTMSAGKIYSFKKLPIIGGDYSVDNFDLMDIVPHFSSNGQISSQIKDLPDGLP